MKTTDVLAVAASSLGPFIRKGQEGRCLACHKPVTAHVDRSGRWLGCSNGTVADQTTFVLVPAEPVTPATVLPEKIVAPAASQRPQARRFSTVKTGKAKVHDEPRRASVAYVAKFPLTHAKVTRIDSERDKGIYRLLRQHPAKGLTRAELLARLNTDHTGVVDGALRRLRVRGVVTVQDVAA